MALRAKEGGGLVTDGEEALRLTGRGEPAHDFLSLSGVPVRCLGPIVQPLVGTAIGVRAKRPLGDTVARQLVGDQHARRSPVANQLAQETLGPFGIPTARQNQCFRPLIEITTSSRCHFKTRA